MNIHEEKVVVNMGDMKLLSRMLAYAKPYWKMIVLCIVLAFITVAADLARPVIIQIAIDDHIKGLDTPMAAVPAAGAEGLRGAGKGVVLGDQVHYRVSSDRQLERLAAIGYEPTQLVEVPEAGVYLISGWLEGDTQTLGLEQSADGPVLVADGVRYPAQAMDADAVALFREQDYSGFLILGFVFLLTVVAASALNYLQQVLLQFTGQNIIFNIRQKLFHHLSRMHMGYFDRNPVGRLVVRVTQDTEALNQLYSQVVVTLVKDVLMLLGIVMIMLHYSVQLTLLTFVVLPIMALMTFAYRILVRKAQRRARTILSTLNSFLAENLSGIRITQLFIREKRQWEEFDRHNQDYYRAGMRSSIINSIFQPAIGFIGNFAIALLIWYGGGAVIQGAVDFGVLYMFTLLIRQFFNPLQSLAEKYNQIQTAMVGAERIFSMLDEKPAVNNAAQPKALPQPIRGEIEFENVWFAYDQEDWVLKDVNLKIEPGQTVAFVGATGAGKSSVIQLINRFYDIQKGSIKLDGVDIRDLSLQDLRKTIGIVQQDVFLFTGDIAHNIRLNDPSITDEQVYEAARMVHMDDYIKSLPDGYGTMLGERGVNLSLGQRQLLSFARAIAFRPHILILDEATSNIDTETELVVQDALRTISKGRTTLIVAHRLSTIQHADQIVVMHKGKVREVGNHYQLLAKRGYYYKLYELQYKESKPALKGQVTG